MANANEFIALGMSSQLANAVAAQMSAGSVSPQAAPTITVADPPDSADIKAQFDALIAVLKTTGALT